MGIEDADPEEIDRIFSDFEDEYSKNPRAIVPAGRDEMVSYGDRDVILHDDNPPQGESGVIEPEIEYMPQVPLQEEIVHQMEESEAQQDVDEEEIFDDTIDIEPLGERGDFVCDSCGYTAYDPVRGVCLRCGSTIYKERRMSMKTILTMTLVLFLISSAFLYMAVVFSEPSPRIGDLGPEMNHRFVQITGTVVDASWSKEKYDSFGRLSLQLYDGTGLVWITLADDITSELNRSHKIPGVGTRLRAGGIFYGEEKGRYVDYFGKRVYEVNGNLKIDSPDRIEILPCEYKPLSGDMRNISSFSPGMAVEFTTPVMSVMEISKGLLLRTYNTTEVDVVLPDYIILARGINRNDVVAGSTVHIRGGMMWYESSSGGEWEVMASDISILSSVSYRNLSLQELMSSPERWNNTSVSVSGTVSYIYTYEGKDDTNKFRIEDNGTSLVVYIGDREKYIPLDDIKMGYRAIVKGLFEKYISPTGKVEWEIYIRSGSQDGVEIVPVNITENYVKVDIDTLLSQKEEYSGEFIDTTGTVDYIYWTTDTDGNQYTYRFKIKGSGDETLLVYIGDKTWRLRDIAEGDVVEVRGKFQKYSSGNYTTWEIYIGYGPDDTVKVISSSTQGGEYTSVSLSVLLKSPGDYNGTAIETSGTATGIRWYTSPEGKYTKKFYLSDGSDDITVYIADSGKYLYEGEIQNGSMVKVRGTVSQYMGKWEIYVDGGNDGVEVVDYGGNGTTTGDSGSEYTTLTIATLMASPQTYENTSVEVQGTAVDIYWDSDYNNGTLFAKHFNLIDTGGKKVKVYVANKTKFVYADHISNNSLVKVRGRFQQYNGEWEIYIDGGDDGITVISMATTRGIVLFDRTKDEDAGNADWVITGAYSSWAQALRSRGYDVLSLSQGPITQDRLKGIAVLVLPEPQDPFSAEEVNAIKSFVQNGGGLIIIADHAGADRNNNGWDAVGVFSESLHTDDFGIDFNMDDITADPTTDITNEVPEITYGISALGMWDGTTMTLSGGARAIAYASGKVVVASAIYGSGHVVAIGDSSMFDDGTGNGGNLHDGWSEYDNSVLAVNIVIWASGHDTRGYMGGDV